MVDPQENLDEIHTHHIMAAYYQALGYSVIPVFGPARPDQFKVAAIPWKLHQRQRATERQLADWFIKHDYRVAIVTGRLSNLLVLDFDDLNIYSHFCNLNLWAIHTRTIQTRRGIHMYFRVPPTVRLESARARGLDMQFDGCYVVAPPTEGYQVRRGYGGQPLEINQMQADLITTYIEKRGHAAERAGEALQEEAELAAENSLTAAAAANPTALADLVGLYRRLAPQMGRNNALFRVACLARDHHYTQAEALHTLTNPHIRQKANGQHRTETQRQRRHEAEDTIRSAYRYPVRPVTPYQEAEGLPNRVREALLRHKHMPVVRLIEGLRQAGIHPGDYFTRTQALALLAGVLGRNGVDAALRGVGIGGASFFPPQTGVASLTSPQAISFCQKIGMKKRGQLARVFRMPSNREMAELVGVKHSSISDPLTGEDVRSAKRTRMALHRGFLTRKPGEYSNLVLAERLSITARTIQRYHTEDESIRREPVFTAQRVFWHNLHDLIPDEWPHGACFLTDGKGKRYPAQLGIARRLLSWKKTIYLNTQHPNYYTITAPVWARPAVPITTRTPVGTRFCASAPHTSPHPRPSYTRPAAASSRTPVGTRFCASATPHTPPTTRTTGRRKLKNPTWEKTALHLYNALKTMYPDGKTALSLKSARRMVAHYRPSRVLRCLRVVQNRRNVRKPVGLLATILRSESSIRHYQLHV